MACLLDTHIWIWWMTRQPRLPARVLEQLDEMPERPFLSVASIWELSLLVENRTVVLDRAPEKWLAMALHPRAVRLAPISREVAAELFRIPKGFHRDPADRMIVATARALDVPLFTRDKQIRSSGLVRLWKER